MHVQVFPISTLHFVVATKMFLPYQNVRIRQLARFLLNHYLFCYLPILDKRTNLACHMYTCLM